MYSIVTHAGTVRGAQIIEMTGIEYNRTDGVEISDRVARTVIDKLIVDNSSSQTLQVTGNHGLIRYVEVLENNSAEIAEGIK